MLRSKDWYLLSSQIRESLLYCSVFEKDFALRGFFILLKVFKFDLRMEG